MKVRRKFLHIRKIIWDSQSIGISGKNWDRLNSGFYSGVKIDQKIRDHTMYPGVFQIPTCADRKNWPSMRWKGVILYLFRVCELSRNP